MTEQKSKTNETVNTDDPQRTRPSDVERHEREMRPRPRPTQTPAESSRNSRNKNQRISVTAVYSRDVDEELYIKRLLVERSFHLPRHNWCQDWMQYIANNHPLLGLFLHHPLHPLGFGHRIFIFIGSVSFGLAATNGVYLWYAYTNKDMNEVLLEISLGNRAANTDGRDLKITHGMIALWTFGSIVHAFFDIIMWFLSACVCFLEGGQCGKYSRLRSIGSYATIAIVGITVAFASFVVAARAIYEARLNAAKEDVVLDDKQWLEVIEFESFSFLLGYGVESLLVYFAYYPLMVTIAFSGCLQPCFRCLPFIRFLGGRPKEVERQLKERLDTRQKNERIQSSSSLEDEEDIIMVH